MRCSLSLSRDCIRRLSREVNSTQSRRTNFSLLSRIRMSFRESDIVNRARWSSGNDPVMRVLKIDELIYREGAKRPEEIYIIHISLSLQAAMRASRSERR